MSIRAALTSKTPSSRSPGSASAAPTSVWNTSTGTVRGRLCLLLRPALYHEDGMKSIGPLESLEEWDDFVKSRYRENKSQEEFRNYRADANPTVENFYRENHAKQTLDFVLAKKAEYTLLKK